MHYINKPIVPVFLNYWNYQKTLQELYGMILVKNCEKRNLKRLESQESLNFNETQLSG